MLIADNTSGLPPRRMVVVAMVIGMHALVGLAFVTQKIVIKHASPPLTVMLLKEPASIEPPPQTVEIKLQPPASLPVAIAPPLIATPAADSNAISAVAGTSSSSTPTPNVSDLSAAAEARFDADYLHNPPPHYPPASRRFREQGTVVLKVKVSADGMAELVMVYQPSGSLRLDEAALATVKQWKFVPATRGAQAIESWVLVPIEFALRA